MRGGRRPLPNKQTVALSTSGTENVRAVSLSRSGAALTSFFLSLSAAAGSWALSTRSRPQRRLRCRPFVYDVNPSVIPSPGPLGVRPVYERPCRLRPPFGAGEKHPHLRATRRRCGLPSEVIDRALPARSCPSGRQQTRAPGMRESNVSPSATRGTGDMTATAVPNATTRLQGADSSQQMHRIGMGVGVQ